MNYKYHARDCDTEFACAWIEDFITVGDGRKGTKVGIQRMFNAFDHLMEKDFRDFPNRD